MSSQVIPHPNMLHDGNNNNSDGIGYAPHRNPLHLQQQQRRDIDRRVLQLNNRACVLVLSNGEYSEAIKLFDTALMIHKEQTEEGSNNDNNAMMMESSPTTTPTTTPSSGNCSHQPCDLDTTTNNNIIDYSCHSCSEHVFDEMEDEDDEDFSEEDLSETDYDCDDFGDMDWDGKDDDDDDHHDSSDSSPEVDDGGAAAYNNHHQPQHQSFSLAGPSSSSPSVTTMQQLSSSPSSAKIQRMTTASRLRTLNYCGQQEHHSEHGLVRSHHYHHQVYSLPIVMEESEWDTAPVQDKTFVLIFNTALCNHLWGMQLMQRYIAATTTTTVTTQQQQQQQQRGSSSSSDAIAEHCRETLTIAKLLYKLALENSVSFANGVDKICYVALYNNLSHVLKTLEGYDSAEARWCDDMLLKAIFWWRDSTNHAAGGGSSSGSSSANHHSHSSSSSSARTTEGASAGTTTGSLSDLYLDDDAEIIDAFLENVYYRVGVPESIVPAAAA
eukprot:CAMPEP_0197177320 /NCGR_PEP_ID=MMETSP1423-20130617/2967_1 /TAXON_ID=476441 /ORGANISM="Pseudo-nitzschia heimii, Strain UNC1101" /LENGTH=495 /DNA_ID=CAMNT_0042626847 /DNA_START=252 /DNA_END=1739 /DNA_ORIENTATION=+